VVERAFGAIARAARSGVGGARLAVSCTALLGVSALATAAQAQTTIFDRDENVPVLSRPHPEYQALGIREGPWTIYPKITLDVVYDDNIFAASTGAQGDTFLVIQPQILVQSNWSRNALSFEAGSTINEYAKHSSEDTTQYNVSGTGRLDIDRDMTLDGKLGYQSVIIPRTSAAYTELSINPLQYQETAGDLSFVDIFNRIKLTVTTQAEHDVYLNGTVSGGAPLIENFRNNIHFGGLVRGDYAISPDIALFLEENISEFHYDNLQNRDSWGTETLAGVNFQVTHLMTGEVGVGYLTETYENPLDHNTGTFDARAQLQWFPTQLVTVTLSGTQALYDSGLIDSPAFLARSVQLQADYELLRNFVISARAGDAWDTYTGIDRRDNSFNAGISFNYLLNRVVGLGLHYSRLTLVSSGLNRGQNFNDDRIGLALTLQR